MRKLRRIMPSDFYWGISTILSAIFFVCGILSMEIISGVAAIVFYILSLILCYSNKVREKIDYE